MDVASLVFLGLPQMLRTRAELIFTWWGVSLHVTNLNPFLDFALSEFYESVEMISQKNEDRADFFSF